jgi:hypothetical protein
VRIDQADLAMERNGHRVHGEVAPLQVIEQVRGLDLGQGAWARIGLPPGGGDVERHAVHRRGDGAEALVHAGRLAEPFGERERVPLDGDVQVRPVGAQKQVAHRAANQVGRQARGRDRFAQRRDSRQGRNAIRQERWVDRRCFGRHQGGLRALPYHDGPRG